LFKPESWTEIFVQPENWIGSGCSTCSKLNSAATLFTITDQSRFSSNFKLEFLNSKKNDDVFFRFWVLVYSKNEII
jgi:hypothetical protein